MRIAVVIALGAALASAGCAGGAGPRDESAGTAAGVQAEQRQALGLVRLARGLPALTHAAAPASEPDRLYLVEQQGRIRVLRRGRLLAAPFLDIRNIVRSGGEQGLLSVAFHPNYAKNRRFYVNYTDRNGDTRVVEYRSNGRRAILSTRRQLLRVRQPYANHNGGQLAFGPNGRLYVGMGDGGSGGDPENRAQNMGSLLGKILTLDVGKARPRPGIDALGLRNPWRFAFDRVTGDLYVADVGQNAWEEVNYLPRARLPRLQNYGWDVFEGRARYEDKARSRGDLVTPIAVYGRGAGCSVTGGFVYRGEAVPAAVGRYFYGDFCSGTVWSLKVVGGKARQHRKEPFRVPNLSSFGEDARGELYLVTLGGEVYRLRR